MCKGTVVAEQWDRLRGVSELKCILGGRCEIKRDRIYVLFHKSLPQTEWLKPTNTYHHMISVGQESEHCLVGCP